MNEKYEQPKAANDNTEGAAEINIEKQRRRAYNSVSAFRDRVRTSELDLRIKSELLNKINDIQGGLSLGSADTEKALAYMSALAQEYGMEF